MEHFVQTNMFVWIRTVLAHLTIGCVIRYPKIGNLCYIPYMRKILWYEIFAEQEANRIFSIIFSRVTGPSWKGSMCYVLLQI